jgi:hypothetical protein
MAMLAKKLGDARAERVVEVQPPEEGARVAAEEPLGLGWVTALPLAWAFIYGTALASSPRPRTPTPPRRSPASCCGWH